MKKKVLMLDEMTKKEKDVLSEFTDFNCPCTGVDHVMSPEIIYLEDEFKKFYSENVTSTAECDFWRYYRGKPRLVCLSSFGQYDW